MCVSNSRIWEVESGGYMQECSRLFLAAQQDNLGYVRTSLKKKKALLSLVIQIWVSEIETEVKFLMLKKFSFLVAELDK